MILFHNVGMQIQMRGIFNIIIVAFINFIFRPTFAQISDSLNKILLPIKSKSRTLKFGRADTGLQFENDER